MTRLVLVNAIYLKSPWSDPFKPAATKPAPFYVNGTQPAEVPMMNRRHELAFAQGNGFVAVALPLAHPFRFLIFLPDKRDGLAQMEKRLTPDMLGGKLKWEERYVALSLPRFKIEPPVLSLSVALQTLGIKTAFDIPPGSANFDRIAPRWPKDYLAISDVLHKTFLNVDESGIEAAAATAVTLNAFYQPPKPVEVKVNHPFLFAITSRLSPDSTDAACLFLGHVTDPR